jgi:hypothetical protein
MFALTLRLALCVASPPTESAKCLVQNEKAYHPFSGFDSFLFGSEDPKSSAMFTPSFVCMTLHFFDKI